MDSISQSAAPKLPPLTSSKVTLNRALIFECQKLRQNFQHAIESVWNSKTKRTLAIRYGLAVVLMLLPLSTITIENYSHFDSWMFPYDRIDWHDWDLIEQDELRSGFGDQGIAAYLPEYPQSSEYMNETFGYNGYLSERIALDRALPDLRPQQCISELYARVLPNVSVIIVFHNEHLQTLLRTCYTIVRRTPAKLLSEIILVDDASTTENLANKLVKFTLDQKKLPPIIKVIRLEERHGAMKARIIGAKEAQSKVLVFLDAHCETNHNWLPPLLDAMINNDYGDDRTVVVPTIDVISNDTFAYSRLAFPDGHAAGRGIVNLNFQYVRLPLLASGILNPSKPFETPIMGGSLFAINANFWWEIGAYDDGLNTYGAGQYELSLKIWLCGGRILETACSRVGHIFRPLRNATFSHIKYDFIHTNFKRIAEIWLGKYKEYYYRTKTAPFSDLDEGNITSQLELKQRLQCKSYHWFLDNVAFDWFHLLKKANPNDTFDG